VLEEYGITMEPFTELREKKEPYSEFIDRHIFTKRAVSAEQ
jgi:hypothetical protein